MAGIWRLSEGAGGPGGDSFLWGVIGNLAHAPLFGLLAMWIALAGRRVSSEWESGRVWVRLGASQRALIVGGVLLWGIIDELHQSQVPGRTASFWDLATDGLAAWMVLWVVVGVGAAGASEGDTRLRLGLSALVVIGTALGATLAG